MKIFKNLNSKWIFSNLKAFSKLLQIAKVRFNSKLDFKIIKQLLRSSKFNYTLIYIFLYDKYFFCIFN